MQNNRLDIQGQSLERKLGQAHDDSEQEVQLGGELVARVKKLAVEKPVVVVAAGLALGVLTGFILKRN